MGVCAVCGKDGAQRAHVKDKAMLIEEGKNHDYFNIVPMCAYCHYSLFDEGFMAILIEEQKFLILKNLSPIDIEEVDAKLKISLKPEYVDWKNEICHSFLQAAIWRKKKPRVAISLN